MSVNVIARVLWTDIPVLKATHKFGKKYAVSPVTAKAVLTAIADSADDFGENSYNSMETLAKKSSLKLRSVPRVVRALEQNGYCLHCGLSIYGTNNWSIKLDKLGRPPERRARTGRPKSSDSSNILDKSSDSGSKSSDSESPDPSLILKDYKYATLVKIHSSVISPPDGIITAQILGEMADEYPVEWFEPAYKIAVENNARSLKYVKAVLKGWKDHYFGWKPGDRQGKPQETKKSAPPPEDDGREMVTPEMLRKAREKVSV